MESRPLSYLVNFPKPPVGKTHGRIKFGYRKNGTRWFYGLPSRKARQEEIENINRVLEMMYGKR